MQKTSKPSEVQGNRLVGLVLLSPAVLCCLTELLIPTVRTLWLSFQRGGVLQEAEFAGLANYGRLFADERLPQVVGFTLLFAGARLLIVAVLPLLLGWSVGRLGRPVRLGVRFLLSIPLVLFVPVAIAAVWLPALNPVSSPFGLESPLLADPGRARATLIAVDAIYFLGLACSLGVIVYAPLWRRAQAEPQPQPGGVAKPLLALWGVSLLATLAVSLPLFTLVFTLTRGGPANRTLTLGMWQYLTVFQQFQFGVGAAIASLTLSVALVMGTLAGLLLIGSRLRLFTPPRRPPEQNDVTKPVQARALPLVGLLVALPLVLGICALGAFPFGWLARQAGGADALARLSEQIPIGRVWFNTLAPAVASAFIQVAIAYVGALGIGAFRPFGRRSRWLLLPFSPWLFVTLLPLSLAAFLNARDVGTLNTLVGLISPTLLSVPALFILTLFFLGQATRMQPAGAHSFGQRFVLPSLPLTAFLLVGLAFAHSQNLFWSLIAAQNVENLTAGAALVRLMGTFSGDLPLVGAAVVYLFAPLMVLFLVCVLVLQPFLDRLGLDSEPGSLDRR